MDKKDVKILAIVGMCGSGKSTAIDYLTDRKIPKIYFGGVILKGMAEAGLEDTPENEKKFREEIREKEGKDFVVNRVVKEAKDLIAAGQKRIVLDGLYTWTEYKILRQEFPTEMTVIAIVVPKALRRKRLAERPERPFNAQQAAERRLCLSLESTTLCLLPLIRDGRRVILSLLLVPRHEELFDTQARGITAILLQASHKSRSVSRISDRLYLGLIKTLIDFPISISRNSTTNARKPIFSYSPFHTFNAMMRNIASAPQVYCFVVH